MIHSLSCAVLVVGGMLADEPAKAPDLAGYKSVKDAETRDPIEWERLITARS